MDFKQTNKYAYEIIKKLKYSEPEDPVAIIKFGSATRPEDFITDISDLDLLILFDEHQEELLKTPIPSFRYSKVDDVFTEYLKGNPVIIDAIVNGEVLHDRKGLIADWKFQKDNWMYSKNIDRKNCLIRDIGFIISSAMNRYFSNFENDDVKFKILRSTYSASKFISMLSAYDANKTWSNGYTAIMAACVEPSLKDLMFSMQERLINHSEISCRKASSVVIGDDELGMAILAVESAYIKYCDYAIDRVSTNSLIEEFQTKNGKLDRTLAVRFGGLGYRHTVIGMKDSECYKFGVFEAEESMRFFDKINSDFLCWLDYVKIYDREPIGLVKIMDPPEAFIKSHKLEIPNNG